MDLSTFLVLGGTFVSTFAAFILFNDLNRKIRKQKKDILLQAEKLAILRNNAPKDFEVRLRETLRKLDEISPSSRLSSNDEISLNLEKLRQQISVILQESDLESTVTIIIDSKETTRVIKLENLRTSDIDEITQFLTSRFSKNIK